MDSNIYNDITNIFNQIENLEITVNKIKVNLHFLKNKIEFEIEKEKKSIKNKSSRPMIFENTLIPRIIDIDTKVIKESLELEKNSK